MTADRSDLIVLRGVTKTYRTGEVSFTALHGVDLSVSGGELLAIVGPSGSGKSTLLNLVAAIDRPTGGRVEVDGVDVGALSEDDAARWRGRAIGVVFQFFQLLPTLTLADNVALPMDLGRVHPKRERPVRARELLDRVGLADHADKLPAEVSGGQQQRAAIARALANDPPLLLGDEPTGNLDSEAAATILDLFADLTGDGRTIVMVTHDRDLAGRAGRIVEVRDGRLADRSTAVA